MEASKFQKLEPKEWLDTVLDHLDQLNLLRFPPLAPLDCEFYLLTGEIEEFPRLHVPIETLQMLSSELGISIEHRITGRTREDGICVEHYLFYRSHRIYEVDFVGTVEEAQALCN